MTMPAARPLARPNNSLRRVTRTRKESASQLVRMEFEKARLEREIALSAAALKRSKKRLRATEIAIRNALAQLSMPEEARDA